jgi:radical SAM protein with 4Fe4S-binding SPASM domain
MTDKPMDFSKYLTTPMEVTWDLTRRCNLSCTFCLEDSLPQSCAEEVGEEVRQKILSEIIACKVLKVNLSGGEPFLMPNLEEYVAQLVQSRCSVSVTSNGLLITEERARAIQKAGVRRVEITIYPHVMEQSFKAIGILKKAGVEVVPRGVYTKDMANTLGAFIEACAANNIEQLVMQEVVPQGRAMEDFDGHCFTEDEVTQVIETLKEEGGKHSNLNVVFTSTTLAEKESGCATGCVIPLSNRKRCEIRPDGNVVPCFVATIYGIENNLLQKGLKQAWLDIPELYAHAIEKSCAWICSSCSKKENCPGGCPAEHEARKHHGFSPSAKVCTFYIKK